MFRVESNMHVHMCLTNMQSSTVAVSYMHTGTTWAFRTALSQWRGQWISAGRRSTQHKSAVNGVWNEYLVVCGEIYGEEKLWLV